MSVRRRRLAPAPTRIGWALIVVLLILIGGVGVAVARAEQEAVEIPRFEPSSRGGRDAVVELVDQHFPPEWSGWAIRTARCETGGTYDLYAHSSGWDRVYGWYEHVSAWQVSVPTWGAKAWELFGGSLDDLHVSAAMAAWIVVNVGPGAWPTCGR